MWSTITAAVILTVVAMTSGQDDFPPSSSNLRFIVTPEAIKTGLNPTASLTVECYHNGTGNVKYMGLGIQCGGTGSGARIAYRNNNEQDTAIMSQSIAAAENAVVTSRVENNFESFIKMVITNPDAALACLYMCHSKQGDNDRWAYAAVAVTETTVAEMLDLLIEMRESVATLEEKVIALEETEEP